jgi:phosphodiester glycosidase
VGLIAVRCCFALTLLLLISCKKADPPPPAAGLQPNAVRPVPAGGLSVADEIAALGLRVRAGTWAAPDASALWGFSDIELDASRTRLEIELAKNGATLAQLSPARALAVVNGGYFEADFRPSTWLKNSGVELAPKSDTSKGGVLAFGASGIYVGPFSGLGFEPELAVQSFPLLVEPDRKQGIYRDDGRRAARTIACLVDDKLHFIVISAPRGDGPTLFETATLLRTTAPEGFGCRVALNLDGGPSTGVWFAPQIASRQRPPLSSIGYAIAILPR